MPQFRVKVTLTKFFDLDTADFEDEDDDEAAVSVEDAMAQFEAQVEDGDVELDDGVLELEKVEA